ncbi:MAG: hypothetical protein IJY61_00090 [Candidatus Gastranaerophilales bacterium]|nr:hypothetical protein [Candidatus Gastranaerophilales bacterium]
MKILPIKSSLYSSSIPCNVKKSEETNLLAQNKVKIDEISSCYLKANYLPSFGKYKKVADITLINRDTEMPVRASLRKEKTGDFVSFQIITGRKDEAGFLHMNLDPTSIRGERVLTNKKGNPIPEVTHLRSISGDKYKGIGTALIYAAIVESLKANKDGELFLKAETGYGSSYSDYRKWENPIPFYHKMGFEAVDCDVNSLIQECIKKADYEKLPPSALLLLSSDSIKAKNLQFSKDYKLET